MSLVYANKGGKLAGLVSFWLLKRFNVLGAGNSTRVIIDYLLSYTSYNGLNRNLYKENPKKKLVWI